MKRIRVTMFILVCTMLGCSPLRVSYDYETTTNFSQYKTYNYFDDMRTGLSGLDTKRFIRALDANLQAQGYKRTTDADFYIDIQSEIIQNSNYNNVGIGVGGTGGNVGGGVTVGVPMGQNMQSRAIKVEFMDLSTKQVFWQALSRDSFGQSGTPEKRSANFKAIAEKILSGFPPR